MSSLFDYTGLSFIKKLESGNKYDAIEELALLFGDYNFCMDINLLIEALKDRESIMSTGIGAGIAIPHAKISCIRKMGFAIGISKEGIDFDSMDGFPVNLVILVVAGEDQHKEYLRLISRVMAILKSEDVKERIIASESPEEIIEILKNS